MPETQRPNGQLQRVVKQAGSRITEQAVQTYTEIPGTDQTAMARLQIRLYGNERCTIAVSNPDVPLGGIVISNAGDANYIMFGNQYETSVLTLNIRLLAGGCTVLFPGLPQSILRLQDIFLRNPNQTLFWGLESTAVDASIELAGDGASMLIGDDCMFSTGIWLRNFDMHSIFDIETGDILNHHDEVTLIERHVWFGADACLLGARRIGFGSIIGARSMVASEIPHTSIAAGTPARVVRSGVSWSRDIGIAPQGLRNQLLDLASLSHAEG